MILLDAMSKDRVSPTAVMCLMFAVICADYQLPSSLGIDTTERYVGVRSYRMIGKERSDWK
jgi:hypothetical protein